MSLPRRDFLTRAIKGIAGTIALPYISWALPAVPKVIDPTPDSPISVFEVGGQSLFPVYESSGGITTAYIMYLICVREGKGYKFPIQIQLLYSQNESHQIAKLANAMPEFVKKFNQDILNGTAERANFNGGDLGLGHTVLAI